MNNRNRSPIGQKLARTLATSTVASHGASADKQTPTKKAIKRGINKVVSLAPTHEFRSFGFTKVPLYYNPSSGLPDSDYIKMLGVNPKRRFLMIQNNNTIASVYLLFGRSSKGQPIVLPPFTEITLDTVCPNGEVWVSCYHSDQTVSNPDPTTIAILEGVEE